MGIQQNYLYRVMPDLAEKGQVTKSGRGWHLRDGATYVKSGVSPRVRGLACACCSAYWPPAAPAQAETFDGTAPSRAHQSRATPWCGAQERRRRQRARARPTRRAARRAWCSASPAAKGNRGRDFGGVPGARQRLSHTGRVRVSVRTSPQIERLDGIESTGRVKARVCRPTAARSRTHSDCNGGLRHDRRRKVTRWRSACQRAQPCCGVWIVDGRKIATPAPRPPGAPGRPVRGLAGTRQEDGVESDHGRRSAPPARSSPPTPPERAEGVSTSSTSTSSGNVVDDRGRTTRDRVQPRPTPRPRVASARRLWARRGGHGRLGGSRTSPRDAISGPDRLVLVDLRRQRPASAWTATASARRPVGELALTDQRVAWSVRARPRDLPHPPQAARQRVPEKL